MSKVAIKADPVHDDKPILIDPKQVFIDAEFQKTRKLIVHAPAGAVPDDMRSPGIWKTVQGNRFAGLRADDVLSIRAHDGSWRVDAEVISVRNDSAALDILKVRSRPVIHSSYSDDRHRVDYEAGAWWAVNIETGARVGHGFATESMAIGYARSLTPQKVG
jgi:hypothetical protein